MYDFGKLKLYYTSIISLFWNKNKSKKYCFEVNAAHVNDLWLYSRFDPTRLSDSTGTSRHPDPSHPPSDAPGTPSTRYTACIYTASSPGETCHFCPVRHGKTASTSGWKKIHVLAIFKFFYSVVCKLLKLIVYWVS